MELGPNSKSWPNGVRFCEIIVLADFDFAENQNPQKSSKLCDFSRLPKSAHSQSVSSFEEIGSKI